MRPPLTDDQKRGLLLMLVTALITQGYAPTQITAGVQPCSCRYGLWRVAGAPGPYVMWAPPGIRTLKLYTRAFQIDPHCPHHGDN